MHRAYYFLFCQAQIHNQDNTHIFLLIHEMIHVIVFNFFAGSCAQWEIYDEYIKDIERQKVEEALRSKTGKKAAAAITEKKQDGPSLPPMELPSMNKSMRILDRMVNQNMYEEIAMDFMYWEDASDAFRYGELLCFRSVGEMFSDHMQTRVYMYRDVP